jgi:hypothetical protein
MGNYSFYVAAPDGIVRENPLQAPLDVVKESYPEGTIILRFGLDQANNTVFIQDESFRERMKDGDEAAWELVNRSLEAIESKTGIRFPKQEHGDPPDSAITRNLSDYQSAWDRISKFMGSELGVSPVDMPVYEYVAGQGREAESVIYLPTGTYLGDAPSDRPMLGVNRMLHRAVRNLYNLGDWRDVDGDLMGDALACFYLDNIDELMNDIGTPGAKAVLDAIQKEDEWPTMFAMDLDGSTRVFRAKDDLTNEASIRDGMPWYDGPIVMFHFDKDDNSIVVRNHLLSCMYKDENGKRICDDITDIISRRTGKMKAHISMSFDPTFGQPYITKTKHVPLLWHAIIDRDPRARDVMIMEVPFSPGDEDYAVVKEPQDEDKQAPGLAAFRAARGIMVDFPLIVVDNRLNRGRKLRSIAKAYEKVTGHHFDDDENGIELALKLKDEKNRSKTRKKMSRLLEMGMTAKDVLDLYSDKTSLPKRVAYREILDEALAGGAPRLVAVAQHAGGGLIQTRERAAPGINDWWWPSAQEGLKEGDEDEEAPIPLNEVSAEGAQPAPPLRPSMEVLLERDRDELQSQKTTEQLLRESQI